MRKLVNIAVVVAGPYVVAVSKGGWNDGAQRKTGGNRKALA